MKMAFIILTTALLATTGWAEEKNSPAFIVQTIMKDIVGGKFRPGKPGARAVSGWVMTTETGKEVHRAILQDQAVPLISIGPDAVPELLKWLEHEQMHIRYIADYSLEQITGKNPIFPHFATLEELRSKGWLKTSVETWQGWYDANRAKPNRPAGTDP